MSGFFPILLVGLLIRKSEDHTIRSPVNTPLMFSLIYKLLPFCLSLCLSTFFIFGYFSKIIIVDVKIIIEIGFNNCKE